MTAFREVVASVFKEEREERSEDPEGEARRPRGVPDQRAAERGHDSRGFRQSLRRQCPRPFLSRAAASPILGSGGSVILISSLGAHAAVGALGLFGDEGRRETLAKHFAFVLGSRGIRVNAVAPGVVETDMSNFTKTDAGRDLALGTQALKRLAQPDDVGGVVAFLASDDARWISGDTIRVDGGSKL